MLRAGGAPRVALCATRLLLLPSPLHAPKPPLPTQTQVRWLSRFFNYLDRYYVLRHSLHPLKDVGLLCFRGESECVCGGGGGGAGVCVWGGVLLLGGLRGGRGWVAPTTPSFFRTPAKECVSGGNRQGAALISMNAAVWCAAFTTMSVA